jgi:hypothetical protein
MFAVVKIQLPVRNGWKDSTLEGEGQGLVSTKARVSPLGDTTARLPRGARPWSLVMVVLVCRSSRRSNRLGSTLAVRATRFWRSAMTSGSSCSWAPRSR